MSGVINTVLEMAPCNDYAAEAELNETRNHLAALWAQAEKFKPPHRARAQEALVQFAGAWAFNKGAT